MAMKRVIALVLVLLMSACMLPAHAAGAELTYERAVEMAAYMRRIASGDYLAINGVPEELQRTAREWSAGIDGQPRMVVKLDVMESALILETRAGFIAEHPMVLYEAESTAMSYILNYAMLYAAMETVVAESAYEEITEVNSQLNCEMLYAEEAEDGTGMYLVFYDDAEPLLILSSAESGAVSLRAYFVPSEKLARCANHGQVALWFMMYGMPMTCSEVTP